MKKLSVLLLFFFLFLNYDNAGRAQTTIMIGGRCDESLHNF